MKLIFAKYVAKLAASTVFTGAIAMSIGSPARAASLQFIPSGTQLDDDPILDFETSLGAAPIFNVVVDTTGLQANLKLLEFFFERDASELALTKFEEPAKDIFNFSLGESTVDPSTGLLQRINTFTAIDAGLAPNSIQSIVDPTYSVLTLNNDGVPDIRLRVTSALEATGRDVTTLFQPASQSFEVQEVPEPSSILGVLAAVGAGSALKNRLVKSRKAAS